MFRSVILEVQEIVFPSKSGVGSILSRALTLKLPSSFLFLSSKLPDEIDHDNPKTNAIRCNK